MKAIALVLLVISFSAFAQNTEDLNKPATLGDLKKYVESTMANKWYERVNLRGYAQVRYNRILETNKKLVCSTCDSSMGQNQGFFLRRARLVFYGDVNDRVFFYIQPDIATQATGPSSGGTPGANQQNYFQIRDAYFDYHLTLDKVWRVRSGIQKVIFGFENMNSSSNRAALDRSDAINSAAPNERDLGVALMYAPNEVRKRFKDLANAQYKGTGDYGMISFMTYNGQTLNRGEGNNDLHRAVRMTYPFKLQSGQYIEASLQAYEGKYNTKDVGSNKDFYDARQAATLIFYPQPFGFQLEWNQGQGPEFDSKQNKVRSQKLEGGYAQVNYSLIHNDQRFFPYVRYQQYDGGYKLSSGTPSGRMNEWEIGSEWQPNSGLELTVAYAIEDRRLKSSNLNYHEKGNLLRVQAQFNY